MSIGHCPGVAQGAWKHAPIISVPKGVMHFKAFHMPSPKFYIQTPLLTISD